MKNKKLLVLSAFGSLLIIATILGCGNIEDVLFPGGGGGLALFPPRIAVVFNESPTPETMSVYMVNSTTGALTAAANSPFSGHVSCCGVLIDIDPQSRYVYVPNTDSTTDGNDNTVSVYSIDQSTGDLTEVAGSPFDSGGTDPIAARVHPSGNFLYVSNRTSPNIMVFSVNTATGALTPGTAATVSGDIVWLVMDPLGRFLYALACGSDCDTNGGQPDQVFAFTINQATGALTAAGTAATGAYPRTGAVDVKNNLLFVTCGYNDFDTPANVISVFKIDPSTGALTAAGTVPTGDGNFGSAIPPNSGLLVVANRNDETIQVWSIGSTGTLTEATAAGSPFTPNPALDYEHGVFSEPSGKFVYVLDSDNDQIRVGSITSAGALTEVGAPMADGGISFPTSMAIGH